MEEQTSLTQPTRQTRFNPRSILELQHTIGNQGTRRVLSQMGIIQKASGEPVQVATITGPVIQRDNWNKLFSDNKNTFENWQDCFTHYGEKYKNVFVNYEAWLQIARRLGFSIPPKVGHGKGKLGDFTGHVQELLSRYVDLLKDDLETNGATLIAGLNATSRGRAGNRHGTGDYKKQTFWKRVLDIP